MNDVSVAIVGGGITGLAAAWTLQQQLPGDRIVVFEREDRLGGKIHTERVGGFVIEAGPDSILAAKPGGIDLCRKLGLGDRLVSTRPAEKRSYVRRNGRLYELPEGITGLIPSRIAPLLASPLLSVPGRLRAGLDLLLPTRDDDAEETIAGFVRRRLGREAYDWLVEPLLSGIYAGAGDDLSLDATFPQLRELERKHRSLIRGMMRSPRPAGPPRPPFFSLPSGLQEIVEVLEDQLGPAAVRRKAEVVAVHPEGEGYRLSLGDGTSIVVGSVLLAVPAFVAARLVAPFDSELASAFGAFHFVSTATVALGYPVAALRRPLDGHGYLRPRAEGGPVVACTWVSAKWPDRAPDGHALLRVFLGRAGVEEVVFHSDEKLVTLARDEVRQTLGISEAPDLIRVQRWPQGMPQYTLGHADRVARLERQLGRHAGLLAAGHSYYGIGIPDCIRSGERAAAALTPRASAVRL